MLLVIAAMSLRQIRRCGHAASPEDEEIQSRAQMSFEELLELPIKSASHFSQSVLDVASTVTVIPRSSWEERGARRLPDT